MKYFLSIIIALFISINLSYAQVDIPDKATSGMERSVFGVGLSAGWASGFGLSFRHHLPSRFSYQFVAGIIKVDRELIYNVGSEFQYDFARWEKTRLFADVTFGYFYIGETSNKLNGPLRGGIGIGTEVRANKALHICGGLIFTFFSDGDILPLPQFSAHYYFF